MTKRRTCLIIGSIEDPHVRAVKGFLESADFDVIVLDVETTSKISLTSDGGPLHFEILGRPISDFDVILNRIKWRYDPHCGSEEDFARYFYFFEWVYALRGLMFAAEQMGIPVVNGPIAGLVGANKILQLSIANACGLEIPSTYIGTDQAAMTQVTCDWSSTIAKIFESSFIPPFDGKETRTIFTNHLTRGDLAAYGEAMGSDPPLILQEEIAKSVEVRLIASKDHSVCYLIHSQEEIRSRLDWRQRELAVRYELSAAPDTVLGQARKMLRRLSLDYAVFDFALTPDGEWIFFECNPDGQWWLPRMRVGGSPEAVIGHAVLAALETSLERQC